MQIENDFSVPADPERLWALLLDIERVAPCLPGAELTETVDERTWKGRVAVRLGPVSLSFTGTVGMRERDDDAHRVVLHARGTEQRGKGAAAATVTAWLVPGSGATDVKMISDIQLTGAVAQLSRGLLPEVSRKLTAQFAQCLRTSMLEAGTQDRAPGQLASGGEAGPRDAPPAGAGPVRGLRLGLIAIWGSLVRRLGSLFGRRPR